MSVGSEPTPPNAADRTAHACPKEQQLYERLYQKTPAILHSIDGEGRLISVSDQWLDAMGYRRDEVIGRRSVEFLTEESRRFAIDEGLPSFKKHGVCRNVPYDMVRRDGSILHVLLSATSESDEQGRFLRSVAAMTDITGQKKAEKALLLSERRYRAVVEISSDWIWETDEDHRITHLSDQFFELTDHTPEEAVGRRLDQLLVRASDECAESGLIEDLMAHNAFRGLKVRLRTPGERRVIFGINGRPMITSRGTFTGYCGTGTDITERLEIRRRQAEQARMQEMLEREKEGNALQRHFVAMVSHEFRTPLTLIDGAARQMLRLKEKPDPDLLEKRVGGIRNAVVRLTSLIERTLSASRIEEGRMQYSFAETAIEQLLRSLVDRQKSLSRHQIRLELGPLPKHVRADAKLLDQIMTNLLGNAVKYSPDALEILVRVSADDQHVAIVVEDQGVGIPADEQALIFRRFYRASTSSGIVGTGLGLHLTKSFVELHGGDIALRSEEGRGTTVTVRLPIKGPDITPNAKAVEGFSKAS